MGIDVSAEVMIGIWFKSEDEAKDFILNNFDLTKYDVHECSLKYWSIGEISECLENEHGLEFIPYSSYNDYGGCVGMNVGEKDIEYSGEVVAIIYDIVWTKILPEYHRYIKAHIWARYW